MERKGVDAQVLALCGKSEKTLEEIKKFSAKLNFPVRALGYTGEMAKILRAASAIVARPGTGTTSEAILSNCPVIFNGLGGVMPQEWITLKYCRSHGLGDTVYRAEELPSIVIDWMREPQKLEEKRQLMMKIRPENTPRAILKKLLEIA